MKFAGRVLAAAIAMIPYPGLAADAVPTDDAAAEHAYRQSYQRALDLARAGRYEQALPQFRWLLTLAPDDKRLRGDYLVVLGWAGKDAEALAEFQRFDPASVPAYVLLAAAKSARNLKRFDQAVTLYRLAVARAPHDPQGALGLALSLADAGGSHADEAVWRLRALRHRWPDHRELPFALAYAQERRAHYVAALNVYDEILRRAPDDRRARAARILALSSLGADQAALREARRYPRVLDAAQWQRLHEDHAAALLRRAELASGSQEQRFKEIDRALARLDENLRRYPRSLRTRFDRVRALRDRYLMPQAVQAYRQLRAESIDPPSYVHAAAGWACLYLRQPKRARAAFLLALQSKPDDRDARRGLFYAYSDLNDFTRAHALTEDLARAPLTPDQTLQARVYLAWERAFEGHLGEAQRRFEQLWAQAPYNEEIESALGTVYLWRGWPRWARAHYQAVIARAPDNLQARAGQAQAAMALGDYRDARARVETLDLRYPLDADVRALTRAWRFHARRQLHVEAGYGKDLQGQQSSRELRLASYLYAVPVDDVIRPFLHQYYERSAVNARHAAYNRLGAGAVYSAPSATRLSAEVRRDFASGATAGVAAQLDRALDDHWSLGAGFDTDSVDVPLAARAAGIAGRSLNLTADYRASERGGAATVVQRLSMSDGNRRTSVYLNAWRRVVNRPRYQGSVSGEVYASRNTRSDAPYYNPRRDASVSLGYKNDWLIYRRYGRAFQHWLSVSAGVYAEAGFHPAWIAGLRYGHEWSVNDALGLSYSAGYLRRVYDGVAGYTPELRLGVDWRF